VKAKSSQVNEFLLEKSIPRYDSSFIRLKVLIDQIYLYIKKLFPIFLETVGIANWPNDYIILVEAKKLIHPKNNYYLIR